MQTITIPLSQIGEPRTDLNDLWAQLGTNTERHDITVRQAPAPSRYTLTVNGRVV